MKVVFISDIHITDATDPFYGALLTMIESEIGSGDRLVLAGDIFDFLVGYQPSLVEQYRSFFELLRKKVNVGAEIYYIEGNHDFHLESTLRSIPGIHLEKSEIEIRTPLHRLYVAHGDLVDRQDYGYLALRTFFRSPFIRLTASALPERAVNWIGTRSSRASQLKNPRNPGPRSEGRMERTRKIFRDFSEAKSTEGFDAVVLGHCHDDHTYTFRESGRTGTYMNVGYPKAHGSFLVFTDETGLVRKTLPLDSPRERS